MKKIACFILSALILLNATFAKNFFESRFFELRVDVPVSLNNNVFKVGDFLKKDLVIDLPKLAESVPKNGFSTIIKAKPEVQMNLNIVNFSMGVHAGADLYTKINLSKSLFDFVLSGYHTGETLEVSLVNPVLDTFVYAEVPIGYKFKKFSLTLSPGVYYPVAILDNCDVKATAFNDSDGNVKVDVKADANLYVSSLLAPVLDKNYPQTNLDFSSIGGNLGFDLGATANIPFTKKLSLTIDGRFPIVPAKLDTNLNVKANYSMSGNILGMAQGQQITQTPFDYSMTTSPLASPYKINRPLKLNAYLNYNLFKYLRFKAGGGFGIRRVGGDKPVAYPEYYASTTLSLFEMLKANISTEYTDLIFKHQLEAVINLRLVEVDVGVSLEASDFLKSFQLAGLGAYVGVVVGF